MLFLVIFQDSKTTFLATHNNTQKQTAKNFFANSVDVKTHFKGWISLVTELKS